VANKTSLWGYTGDSQSPFLKIGLTDFKHLGRVKSECIHPFLRVSLSLSLSL
jgi:hypothetical protein